ncbi:ABC transporter permease [Turicibacter sanguinis]|uniref:ABC transporter permease n=2 Tax=Turicibacter sanguinis TaxID=154288 RepID=A0A9X4XEX5_9FIRM|nr:ABC transporter permease [Turicibacter sanguinis]EFF64130.1 membrane family protein [Turicibacter sanguinis PC909]MCU7192026.1 ABC transporter permease [Turicibacter sanguinis]MTK21320.1 ABC transporter permease [Turicibacter sanguinis]MTK72381.1 ABC transporter permease [Turicibacter sanguinis]
MRGYLAFVKKELLEQVRTYKLLILLLVFFIFGMLSPLMAKLMPEILSQMPMDGITITIPDPTAIDSYSQFFKNLTQMGLIVLVLLFSGTLTTELSKGTLINVLTKGVTRYAVILAKYTVALVLWSFALLMALGVTYGYTAYFFSQDEIHHLLASVGCLWLFGVLILSLLMWAQTLVGNQYGSLLMVGIFVAGLFVLNLFPIFQDYNPIALVSENVAMLSQDYDISQLMSTSLISVILSIAFLALALTTFKNKRI